MKKLIAIFLYVAVLSFCVWLTYYCVGAPIGIDDAYIFFAYAKNIAMGKGFVYGNCPDVVEGCTSFLWTLVCSVSYYFHLDKFGVLCASFGCLVLTHLIWLRLTFRLCGRGGVIILAAFLLSSPAHLCWMSLTLMDISLYALFVSLLASVIVSDRENIVAASILFAVIPFVRPEMMILGPVALCIYAISSYLREDWSYRRMRIFCYAILFIVSLCALTGFRVVYFGSPLPNTFYAKVSPSLLYNISIGVAYLALFASFGPATISLIGMATGVYLPKWFKNRSLMLFLTAWFVALLMPPILTGGDHFAYYRFYQPIYPMIGLFVAYFFINLWLQLRKSICFYISNRDYFFCLATAVIGMIIGSMSSLQPSWRMFRSFNELHHEFALAQEGVCDGKVLNTVFEKCRPMPTIGVITAGGIATEYKGKIIDLMGLNNVRIAHHKGDRRGKKNHAAFAPEIFPELGVDIVLADCEASFLKGMTVDPEFAGNWRFGCLVRNGVKTRSFLVRKSFLLSAECAGIKFVDTAQWDGKKWQRLS